MPFYLQLGGKQDAKSSPKELMDSLRSDQIQETEEISKQRRRRIR